VRSAAQGWSYGDDVLNSRRTWVLALLNAALLLGVGLLV
jgi:hypothetical protein